MGPNLRILPSASDVARGKGNELLSEGGFSRGDLVLHFRGWRELNVRPGPSPTPWRSFLGELDGLLKASVELRCLGGFVVTQQYGIGRETSDIDFIAAIAQSPHDDVEALAGLKSKLHRKYRLDMQYVGVATPPAEYASRLTRMFPSAPWKQLKLFALHAPDIALSKLERNAERDREDVLRLARAGYLAPQVLKDRYYEELRPHLLSKVPWHDKTLELWLEMAWPTT